MSFPPLPHPVYTSPRQSGISDAIWPLKTPAGVAVTEYEDYRGRVSRQGYQTILAMDIDAPDRAALAAVVRRLSDFAFEQMERKPSRDGVPSFIETPKSYRSAITLGLGASLFLTANGDDRFGLLHRKPTFLRQMPRFDRGDDPNFNPADDATDLLVIILSDHPYVNSYIADCLIHGRVDSRLKPRRMEQGFGRPDDLQSLAFPEGTGNLRNHPGNDLDRLVYVGPHDGEPKWCENGTYLAYRKMKIDLVKWRSFPVKEQERIIGRRRDGSPLPGAPKNCHILKVMPRRPGPDFTGKPDLDRRMLRHPYNFNDPLDESGKMIFGLHFLAYVRNLKEQFEWPVQMWQLNPDFPKRGTGIDAMYAHGIMSCIGGGYYFCPPNRRKARDFVGSGLFS